MFPVSLGPASSAEGSRLAAVAGTGQVFASKDSGSTWFPLGAPARAWTSIDSSADGSRLVLGTRYDVHFAYSETPTPRLSLDSPSQNMLLSWTIPSLSFVPQQTSDLESGNWGDVPAKPTLNLVKLRQELNLPVSPGPVFYRLISR